MRHLPNPYFQKGLRELPGDTPEVLAFFAKHPEADETVRRLVDLLSYLLPKYKREGKSYLTIGVGCTGGRHRSVMVANAIGKALKKSGEFDISVSHRDIQK